jgi:hypothetical protein
MSANLASCLSVSGRLEQFMLGHIFGICLHGKALHGLQGCGNRFLIWLGPPHFRVETLIDLAQGRIVRANGRRRTLSVLRWSRAGRLS